ncbi:MAG: metalloregulator ArsR/SmtB family transcription factor [Acidimicrobiia bacterium]|nr:metalloregulator ArsR/SmtB family transcription factor [Acidimicrobiia bacterium]
MDVGAQLGALADPTRRRIFELLRSGPQSVRELTDRVAVSQPAVSQHLRVLAEARLVTVRPVGAKRLYSANLDGLESLRSWLDAMWDDVLDGFAEAAEQALTERQTTKRQGERS